MKFAPVTLFVYKRLWHTQQTVEALQRNEFANSSELFVFSDGPKSETDRDNVQSVRDYLRTITGFRKVTVVERDINLGLAQSIITGVTEIVNKYGRIIVLEDDMVTSPHFLRFMNEALELYKDEERVISIHGYMYPVKTKLPETFFLKVTDCWGWATWERGWDLFEPDGQKLMEELNARKLTYRFDLDGSYHYTRMLQDQINGKNNSWAIRWQASAFLKDKLTLYPGRSLIFNTGIDASGSHCGATNVFDTEVTLYPVKVERLPIEEDTQAFQAIKEFYRSSRPSFARRVLGRIIRMWR